MHSIEVYVSDAYCSRLRSTADGGDEVALTAGRAYRDLFGYKDKLQITVEIHGETKAAKPCATAMTF